jgi:hypothetical protein
LYKPVRDVKINPDGSPWESVNSSLVN